MPRTDQGNPRGRFDRSIGEIGTQTPTTASHREQLTVCVSHCVVSGATDNPRPARRRTPPQLSCHRSDGSRSFTVVSSAPDRLIGPSGPRWSYVATRVHRLCRPNPAISPARRRDTTVSHVSMPFGVSETVGAAVVRFVRFGARLGSGSCDSERGSCRPTVMLTGELRGPPPPDAPTRASVRASMAA